MDPDDAHLLTAAATGDRTAMEALIRRHAPLVLTACRRQLPAADADDAAQAVFLILWRRTSAAAAAPGLPGWLVVTARQVCANARRSAQRRTHAERAMPSPDKPAPPNEARALLDEALASLPASEREAVIRRHLLGEDPLTVATALHCAEGTIHSRTSRGLERLRTWFARHGIACSATGLLAICSAEYSAAHLVDADTLRTTPSPAAQQLAHLPSLVATLGVPLMSVAALALAAMLTWSQFGAVAPAAADTPPPEIYTKVYDISDLYDQSVLLDRPSFAHAVGPQTPLPATDPAIVATLDACRRLDELTTRIQAIAGARAVRIIDAEMSDEDLRYGQPAGAPDPLPWLREVQASMSFTGIPGASRMRPMLVVGERSAQAHVGAYLRALRDLRHGRLDQRIMAVGTQLAETTQTLYGRDWFVRDGPLATHPPLITRIPAPSGNPFTAIWLPEGAQPYSGKPLAIASDGTCSLLVTQIGVMWQPGIRSAAIALYLRRRLDNGKLHAPLLTEDWQVASPLATPHPWAEGRPDPFADLLDLVNPTRPTTNF